MVYMVEDVDTSRDRWLEFLSELPKEEAEIGAGFWKDILKMYSENPEEENFQSIVEDSLHPDLKDIIGEMPTDYIKALLTDYCFDWLENHGEEEEDRVFYAEDMFRIFYLLTSTLAKQKITIDNLKFAIEHLNKENKDGTTDKELHKDSD